MIKTFNNKTNKVGDDLKQTIQVGSKLDIAAAIFSIYGYESLKKELNKIEKLRFIFTDPTFVEIDKNKREKRMFEINSNMRKKAISGSSLEINLKNKLKGKSIARECRRWIEKKVEFKTNKSNRYIQEQFLVNNNDEQILYNGINEFSSAGLGYEKDTAILRQVIKTDDSEMTKEFLQNFDLVWNDEEALNDVTEEVTEYISNLYRENSPEFIYYLTLYNIFDEFLEDITEDELANEKTGFKDSVIWNKLYDFQKDAVLGIINKLERYNGCILADSVGLGKTFSALGVIKYYQERNKSVLVLCPKKLSDNWRTFLNNYEDNPLIEDRFNYDVLYHTDLFREKGYSDSIDLSRVNWGNYDLLVIDESHNFRNNAQRKDKITRYQKYLAHRRELFGVDYIKPSEEVVYLKSNEIYDEGIFKFRNLAKYGFCTLLTSMKVWDTQSVYMNESIRAAKRLQNLMRVYVIDNIKDLRRKLLKKQLDLDLQSDVRVFFVMLSDIKNITKHPDFGLWDDEYLCIVDNEKEAILSSKKKDIEKGKRWKREILNRAFPIIDAEKDIERFVQSTK